MFNAYLAKSFQSQTATANRGTGRLDSLPIQQGLIEKSELAAQRCIYWSLGAAGAGPLMCRAFAIIRERNWLKVFVRSFSCINLSFVFSLFFFSMDFCRSRKPWRRSYERVTCARGTRGLCARTYHSASPCLCCNVAIQVFIFVARMKVQITQEITTNYLIGVSLRSIQCRGVRDSRKKKKSFKRKTFYDAFY